MEANRKRHVNFSRPSTIGSPKVSAPATFERPRRCSVSFIDKAIRRRSSGPDAVDGSSTGTRVPRSGRRLRLPRFGGATYTYAVNFSLNRLHEKAGQKTAPDQSHASI